MSEQTSPEGFAGRIGARVEDADDGGAQIAFEVRDEHLNPAGTLHGGVVATLVDTAMGQAVRTTTGDGEALAHAVATFALLER